MKKLNLLGLALALAACAPAARAQDVNAESQKLWSNFYILLANMVRGSNEDNRGSDKMFVLNMPGVFVPGTWGEPSEEDRWTAWMLLNQSLEFNPVRDSKSQMPSRAEMAQLGRKPLSEVWSMITEKGVPDPGPPLTPAQKQKLQSLRDLCNDETSARMKAYIEDRNAYLEAETEKEDAIFASYAEKKGGRVAPAILRKATDAEARWKNNGYKGEIEVALQELHELSNADPRVHWLNLRQDLKDAMVPSVKVPRVITIPQMEHWASDSGWIKFTFKMSDTANAKNSNKSDFSYGAKVKIGFYKGGGSASGSSSAMKELNSDKSMSISLEFKKVLIIRPWLDWDVFLSNKWSLAGSLISDGNGKGLLPLVTNAFILVRNVTFKSKAIEKYKTELEKEFHSSANASYGPFSVNASKNTESKSETGGKKEAKGEITIKDPQIIGYFGTVVPKCPAKTVK